jgi:hypothetical protein
MHRLNWSHQNPERRAVERDEQAIERWKQKDWPRVKKRCAAGRPPRLRRRIRVPVDPQPGQNLGPAGPDSGPAPVLSTRENLGDLGSLRQSPTTTSLPLLPVLVRQHPAGGGVRLPPPLAATLARLGDRASGTTPPPFKANRWLNCSVSLRVYAWSVSPPTPRN